MPTSQRSETIEIQTSIMGQDIVFLVTGGKAHIGAVATAYTTDGKTAIVNVLSLPGHREAELAAELAETASLALGRTVALLVGIHLDHPSKRDIEDVVEEARRKMEQILDQRSLSTCIESSVPFLSYWQRIIKFIFFSKW